MLKTILASQDEAYKGALDLFMKNINEKLRDNDNVIKDLTRSLEFTQAEVQDLKQQVTRLESEKQEDKNIICTLRKSAETLEARANYMEDYSRRKNLHISGLEERPGENWEQTTTKVTKLLEENLNLRNVELERAHRMGQPRDHHSRPVIVRFNKYSDREAVRRNAVKLRGTRIYINEDLCQASQAIRKEKMPLLKQARSEGKLAYFNHTRLVIKERTHARRDIVEPREAVLHSAAIAAVGSVAGAAADDSAGGLATGGAAAGVRDCDGGGAGGAVTDAGTVGVAATVKGGVPHGAAPGTSGDSASPCGFTSAGMAKAKSASERRASSVGVAGPLAAYEKAAGKRPTRAATKK